MRLRLAAGLLMAALAGSASAGAWGSGPFENDDAADFATDLARQPDAALVYRTLRAASERSGYLEAPEGSAAVAAAEVVAALNGHPGKGMPAALAKWVQRQKRPTPEQVTVALAAVQRVLGPGSELTELWDEAAPADRDQWKAAIRDLDERLKMRPG